MRFSRLQQHPLLIWFCLLSAIIILAVVSMTIFTLAPNSLGLTQENYVIDSAFTFDQWEISTRHGIISFPEGGLAVEAQQYGHLAAFVIWGPAQLELLDEAIDTSELADIQVTTVFMSDRELLHARGSTYIRSTEASDAYRQAALLLQAEERWLPLLQIFGNLRTYPFPMGTARVIFHDSTGQRFTYRDGLRVSLQGTAGKQISGGGGIGELHPSLLDGTLAIVIYGICIVLLLIATYFITLGWKSERQGKSVAQGVPLLVLLGLAALYAAGGSLLARLQLAPTLRITYDLLSLTLFGYWWRQQVPAWPQRSSLLLNLGWGLLLGGLAVLLGQMAAPRGMVRLPLPGYLTLIAGGLAAAVAQELLWRGLILERLGRHWPGWSGLLLTAGLQGTFAFIAWLIYPFSTLGPLNTLVFLPLQAVWLGYTYRRSHSLLASSTISTCLAILPQLLLFGTK